MTKLERALLEQMDHHPLYLTEIVTALRGQDPFLGLRIRFALLKMERKAMIFAKRFKTPRPRKPLYRITNLGRSMLIRSREADEADGGQPGGLAA